MSAPAASSPPKPRAAANRTELAETVCEHAMTAASSPPKPRAAANRTELAETVTLLSSDARFCGPTERGLYGLANLGAPLPRRLWRAKEGLAILSATTGAIGGPGSRLALARSTQIDFIFSAYRIVLALDLSRSMSSLDAHAASVAGRDALWACTAGYLTALAAPALATRPSARTTLPSGSPSVAAAQYAVDAW
jgi:hypothetical protein